MTAYSAALSGLKPRSTKSIRHAKAPDGSFKWLCEAYYRSAEFKRLDSRTGRIRRNLLDELCREHGEKPARLMEVRHIRAIRDVRSDRAEAANSMLKALRQVLSYGIAVEALDRNPAKDVPYLKTGSQGFHPWSLEEVSRFEETHPIGSQARLAFALLLFTGQRRSDVIKLGRQHVRDDWITFTQHKNRNRKPISLSIPLIPELQKIIAASRCGDLTFLVTKFGRPFTSAGFGNKFRFWCDQAGLSHCSAHGLRKAAASRLAELGASEHEIMAVTGHQTSKEVSRYTRAARQKLLAESAMARVSRDGKQNKSVPLDQSVQKSGTLSTAK